MLVPPKTLLLLLLSHLPPLLASLRPVCVGSIDLIPPGLATDCRAALHMMPLKNLLYNGDNPPSFSLPPTARTPHFTIPNDFRSGNCVISITKIRAQAYASAQQTPAPPVYAASAMYFNVWPALRRGAEEIIKACFHRQLVNDVGTVHVHCEIERTVWKFRVVVEAVPEIAERERKWRQLVHGVGGPDFSKGVGWGQLRGVQRPSLNPPLRRMSSS